MARMYPYAAGQNFLRRGNKIKWGVFRIYEYDDAGGGSDAPDGNEPEALSPLPEVRGLSAKQFLEIQSNGDCGD